MEGSRNGTENLSELLSPRGRMSWLKLRGLQEVVKMVRRHPVVVILILVVVLAASLFLVLRPSQASQQQTTTKSEKANGQKADEKKLPVEVAVVKRGSISSWINTTATLEPYRQVTILAEATGTVAKLMVDEGANVREGQVLAVLSNPDREVALQKANISQKNAAIELQRKQTSYDQKIISQAEYDKAQYEKDVADSELKAAGVAVDRLTIRAPYDGFITDRFIDKGQNIALLAQLFTIVDRDPLEAKIYLPEKEIFGITEEQPVSLALNSQKNLTFQGRIRQISPAVDSRTGTVKVTVEVTNAPAQVRPGSFVDVRLVTQKHDQAILIPKKALIEEAGEQYVFTIDKDVAARRSIQTGFTDDQFAEVISGVQVGQPVVVAGQGALRDGVKTETVAKR